MKTRGHHPILLGEGHGNSGPWWPQGMMLHGHNSSVRSRSLSYFVSYYLTSLQEKAVLKINKPPRASRQGLSPEGMKIVMRCQFRLESSHLVQLLGSDTQVLLPEPHNQKLVLAGAQGPHPAIPGRSVSGPLTSKWGLYPGQGRPEAKSVFANSLDRPFTLIELGMLYHLATSQPLLIYYLETGFC